MSSGCSWSDVILFTHSDLLLSLWFMQCSQLQVMFECMSLLSYWIYSKKHCKRGAVRGGGGWWGAVILTRTLLYKPWTIHTLHRVHGVYDSLLYSFLTLFFVSTSQTQNPATSLAPSACPSTPSCHRQVTSCPRSNSRLCSPGQVWTSVTLFVSYVALLWLHVTWRWRPTSAGTRECQCTTAGGQSGTPVLCPNTSYLKDEENICDWLRSTWDLFDGLRMDQTGTDWRKH